MKWLIAIVILVFLQIVPTSANTYGISCITAQGSNYPAGNAFLAFQGYNHVPADSVAFTYPSTDTELVQMCYDWCTQTGAYDGTYYSGESPPAWLGSGTNHFEVRPMSSLHYGRCYCYEESTLTASTSTDINYIDFDLDKVSYGCYTCSAGFVPSGSNANGMGCVQYTETSHHGYCIEPDDRASDQATTGPVMYDGSSNDNPGTGVTADEIFECAKACIARQAPKESTQWDHYGTGTTDRKETKYSDLRGFAISTTANGGTAGRCICETTHIDRCTTRTGNEYDVYKFECPDEFHYLDDGGGTAPVFAQCKKCPANTGLANSDAAPAEECSPPCLNLAYGYYHGGSAGLNQQYIRPFKGFNYPGDKYAGFTGYPGQTPVPPDPGPYTHPKTIDSNTEIIKLCRDYCRGFGTYFDEDWLAYRAGEYTSAGITYSEVDTDSHWTTTSPSGDFNPATDYDMFDVFEVQRSTASYPGRCYCYVWSSQEIVDAGIAGFSGHPSYNYYDIERTDPACIPPDILDVVATTPKLRCQACSDSSDCDTGLACAQPALNVDFFRVRQGDCQGSSAQENTDTENYRGTFGSATLCADECRSFAWVSSGTLQARHGFHYNHFDQSCYCESLESTTAECGTVGADLNVDRYDFTGYLEPDYFFAHDGDCTGSNEVSMGSGVFSLQECADACRGYVFANGEMAKGFVRTKPTEDRSAGCWCESDYSHPHEDCGQKSTASYERFDFKVPYAFMHYGECRGDLEDPSAPSNTENQVAIAGTHSIEACATLCKGKTWTNNGIKVAVGFMYREQSDACYCESLYSDPHPDCAKSTSDASWARYDYVNYSPAYELKQNSRCQNERYAIIAGESFSGTEEDVALQCARVCQGMLDDRQVGAIGFVIQGSRCDCEFVHRGADCLNTAGWNRYDFETTDGGLYETYGYCEPTNGAYQVYTSQTGDTVERYLENCVDACEDRTTHLIFNPTTGGCSCMNENSGDRAHTEHPCSIGTKNIAAPAGFKVYTLWQDGVMEVSGCQNKGTDMRGQGVCQVACTPSSDTSKDGSDGEIYCPNGEARGFIGDCQCWVDECNPNPCLNGGVCTEGTFTALNDYTCDCTSTGFTGSNCEQLSSCTASADVTKDGSDGTFYCINGGTVSGHTGNCICSDCNSGFGGPHCADTACGENEHISGGVCTACPSGKFRPAGDLVQSFYKTSTQGQCQASGYVTNGAYGYTPVQCYNYCKGLGSQYNNYLLGGEMNVNGPAANGRCYCGTLDPLTCTRLSDFWHVWDMTKRDTECSGELIDKLYAYTADATCRGALEYTFTAEDTIEGCAQACFGKVTADLTDKDGTSAIYPFPNGQQAFWFDDTAVSGLRCKCQGGTVFGGYGLGSTADIFGIYTASSTSDFNQASGDFDYANGPWAPTWASDWKHTNKRCGNRGVGTFEDIEFRSSGGPDIDYRQGFTPIGALSDSSITAGKTYQSYCPGGYFHASSTQCQKCAAGKVRADSWPSDNANMWLTTGVLSALQNDKATLCPDLAEFVDRNSWVAGGGPPTCKAPELAYPRELCSGQSGTNPTGCATGLLNGVETNGDGGFCRGGCEGEPFPWGDENNDDACGGTMVCFNRAPDGGDANARRQTNMMPIPGCADVVLMTPAPGYTTPSGNADFQYHMDFCVDPTFPDFEENFFATEDFCSECPTGKAPNEAQTECLTTCASTPCLNGGTCVDWTTDGTLLDGEIVCTCASGYDGETCQNEVCTTGGHQACQNGGVCFDEAVTLAKYGDSDCFCQQNYYGQRCERDQADTPCGAGEVYKGSRYFPQANVMTGSALAAGATFESCTDYGQYCDTGSNPLCDITDVPNVLRPYQSTSEYPAWARAENTQEAYELACFRACIDFDGDQVQTTSGGGISQYQDGNYWNLNTGWDAVLFKVSRSSHKRCYCHANKNTLAVNNECPVQYPYPWLYATSTGDNGFLIEHVCEPAPDFCGNDFCEIDTVNSPSMCLDGLNTPDCDDCNPCPDSHPFLGGPSYGTQYWCYTDINDHNQGICNMANSGVPPPVLNGVQQTWGVNQPDCVVSTTSLPSSVPCINGGTCTDGVGTFSCSCLAGWEGDRCETDIDECAANGGVGACLNGATCDDSNSDGSIAVDTYRCNCPAGYEGTNCETDTDECAPNGGVGNCLNGATCDDSNSDGTIAVGTYECTCPAGYEGTNCETDTDECAANGGVGACLNGAICDDSNSAGGVAVDTYVCTCSPGYEGTNCETDTDECAANGGVGSCVNGATCDDSNSDGTIGVNTYRCNCPAGYSGTNCETADPCVGTLNALDDGTDGNFYCDNGGTVGGTTGACSCTCIYQFSGLNCNQCAPGLGYTNENGYHECENCPHGEVNAQTSHRAACAPHGCDFGYGYTSDLDPTNAFANMVWDPSDTSTNSGNCLRCPADTESPVNDGQCVLCQAGYEGLDCATDTDECAPNGGLGPCVNGATCDDSNSDGTIAVDTYRCNCAPGWEGTDCEIDTDECSGGVGACLNGATCDDSNSDGTIPVDTYRCNCVPGWEGTNCEIDTDECSGGVGPCVNGATCDDSTSDGTIAVNSYVCTCAPGYEGTDCEIDTDECLGGVGPCLNGASCDDSNSDGTIAVDTYRCNCAPGWEGTNCEIDTDECAPNGGLGSCDSTGTVSCADSTDGTGIAVNSYVCTCAPGFEGVDCEVDINECDPNPCLASGHCTETSDGSTPAYNAFHCLCGPGITGTICEIDIDECTTTTPKYPELCNTTGTDTCDTLDGLNSRNCNCLPGFNGSLCEIDINECNPNPCKSQSICTETTDGVTLAPNEYHCACLDGWIGKNCETLQKKLRLRSPEADVGIYTYVGFGVVAVGFLAFGVSQMSASTAVINSFLGQPVNDGGLCPNFWGAFGRRTSRYVLTKT